MSGRYSVYSPARQRIADRLRGAAKDQLIATAESKRGRGLVKELAAHALSRLPDA